MEVQAEREGRLQREALLRLKLPAGVDPGSAERSLHRRAMQGHSAGYVWYVVALLSAVNVFSYMDRTALSVLMPFIKADLELSDGQLGLLTGFAFFLFYAICGIPVARWADRGNRSNIITIALVVWSAMTVLSGMAQNFWHLLAARVGLGAGEAGCIPAGQSIIADYVSVKNRSSAYALSTFGMSAGTTVGLILAGWLGQTIGWRWTFVVLGLPGIAFALLVKLTLREPVRGAIDGLKDDATNIPMRATIELLLACKTYRLAMAVFFISGFASAGLGQWWPSFYGRSFGMSSSSIGMGLGLAVGAGSAIGTVIGGLMAHKVSQRDVKLPLLFGSLALALSLPTAIGSLFVASSWSSMVLTFLTFLLWAVPSGPITATVYSVTKPRMRATASAIIVFVTSVLGFGLGPLCVGVLSDLLTPFFGVEALRYALLLPACFLVGSAVALCAVARALPGDLKSAGVHLE